MVEEDGYIKIVDRLKDMIIVSGFNVYPNELEQALTLHPDVAQCAAIGVPDAKAGEVVKMFVLQVKLHRWYFSRIQIPKRVFF